MARIRSIKPKFYRHEQLQDLEAAHLGKCVMLVFSGLWGHCDRFGRFEWQPRQLKLDILPFLNFDMAETLQILADAGFMRRYTVNGKDYGVIPTFNEHQRLSGKEAQEGEKFPPPEAEQQGSDSEAPVKHAPSQEQQQEKDEEWNDADDRAALAVAQNRVLEAVGRKGDPNWLSDAGMTAAWLRSGADLELDILPTIRRIVAKRGAQGPPSSLKYFNQAIADAMATRTQPLPPGKPQRQRTPDGPATSHARAIAEVLAQRPADHGTPDAPDAALLAPERGPIVVEGQVRRLAG